MKKIILCLALFTIFSFSVYSQEASTKSKGLLPPYVSVFQSLEGITFFGGGYDSHTSFITTTYLDITLGRKVFFDIPLGVTVLPINTGKSAFGMSLGTGVGFYIFDKRNAEGRGSSLKTSFLYSFKWLTDSSGKNISESIYLMSGGQIFLTYQKHYYKNLALRIGLILGVHAVDRNTPVAINYGLSLGIAF